MNIIRTAIIGCGKVAHIHARALQGIRHAQLVAVNTRNKARGEKFAQTYRAKYYQDIQKMIVECGIEMVIICTPHPNHADSAILSMQSGAHVIVEKPMASTLADCDRMIAVANETGKKLSVISQRRLFSPVQRMRKAIDDGKLSNLVLGSVSMFGWRDEAYYKSDPWRGTWQGEGGGVLVNQAPHQLDLLLWFMGEIDELYGCWANLNHPYIEVDDTAVAVIRFKNGALGSILVSNSQNPAIYGKVTVHGSNGATACVQTDGGAMFIAGMSDMEEAPINDLWTIEGESHLLKEFRDRDEAIFKVVNAIDYYHQLQLKDFVDAIINDNYPLVTAHQGRQTVELFTAIYRSQSEKSVIKFPL